MDRRTFLARSGAMAAVAAVGNLILPQAYAAEDMPLPLATEPMLYVPDKPALVAAHTIERPILEGRFLDWSMAANPLRIDVTSMDFAGFHKEYIPALSEMRVTLTGIVEDVVWQGMSNYGLNGRKLKFYITVEE